MTIILIITISFIATLVRSTFGFGESLVAVPLFLFILPANVAVPLSVMLSVVVALVIVIQDHSKIHFQSAGWLILFALSGIPLGLYVLTSVNEVFIKTFLGSVIILYSLYSLLKKSKIHLKEDKKIWLFFCGFLSGVLGGAYGLNGPPLVVYGNLRKWSPSQFRATLQAYFLPASLVGLTGFFIKGLVTTQVNHYFLWSLIAVLPAIFLGGWLNNRFKDQSFFKYIFFGLILIGIVLIAHSTR